MLEIRKQEASEKAKNRAEDQVSVALAANKIQSIWKGALARRKVRKQREEELAFIGMVSSSHHLILSIVVTVASNKKLLRIRREIDKTTSWQTF